MRLHTSLGVTALVSALFASPVYATNCSLSYYCYRSMTPGPAPVTPVATSRPNPNGSARPNNLQQPRPVNAQATRPQVTNTTLTRPTTMPSTAEQRLAEQQRAQTLADQRRLAALRRNQATPAPRVTSVPPPTPARVTASSPTPASFRPVDNQSCNTLALKIKVLESQAASQARNQQQAKAQELFKIAADLRKQAKAKTCTI